MTIDVGSVEPAGPVVMGQPYTGNPRLRFDLLPFAATGVLGVLEIWAASFPGGNWNLAVGAFLLGIPVTAMWLFLIIDRLLWRHVVGWRRVLFLIVSLPVVFIGTVLVLETDIPIRARVAVSDSALRELALQDPTTSTVGLYDIMDFGRTSFGFWFRTNGVPPEDCGLAYSPTGAPDSNDTSAIGSVYEHVDGPWYTWCTGFD